MVSKIEVIKNTVGCDAKLIFTHNGIKYSLEARSGSPLQKYKSDEWVRGFAGIPCGEHFLWNRKDLIKQPNENTAGKTGIGRGFHISSDKEQYKRIYHPADHSKCREWAMLHYENSFKGSLGCCVTLDDVKTSNFHHLIMASPIIHIPFIVGWEE